MPPPKANLDDLVRQIREQEAQFEPLAPPPETQSGDQAPLDFTPPEPEKKSKKPRREAVVFKSGHGAAPAARKFWTRKTIGFAVWLLLATILLAVAWPLLSKHLAPAPTALGAATEINLDLPMVKILGTPEGPFTAIAATGMNRVRLSRAGGSGTLEVALLGLNGELYPAAKGDDTNPMLPAAADPQEGIDYLNKMLLGYFGTNVFWIIRMGPGEPAPALVVRGQGGVEPHGNTELANAALLRKGYALLDASNASIPFYSNLLTCQQQALDEYDKRTAEGDSVWYHYPMEFPREKLKIGPVAGAGN